MPDPQDQQTSTTPQPHPLISDLGGNTLVDTGVPHAAPLVKDLQGVTHAYNAPSQAKPSLWQRFSNAVTLQRPDLEEAELARIATLPEDQFKNWYTMESDPVMRSIGTVANTFSRFVPFQTELTRAQTAIQKTKLGKQAAGLVAEQLQHPEQLAMGGIEGPEMGPLEAGASKIVPELSVSGPDWERQVVAKHKGEVVGGVGYKLDPDGNAMLHGSVVQSDLRGKGIGQEMYKHAIADAKSNGAKILLSDRTGTSADAARVWGKLRQQGYEVEPMVHRNGQAGFQLDLNTVDETGKPIPNVTRPNAPIADIRTSAAKTAENLGIEFRGIQEGVEGVHPGLAVFQDPETRTSIAVRLNEWSPEQAKTQLDLARERMAPKAPPRNEGVPDVAKGANEYNAARGRSPVTVTNEKVDVELGRRTADAYQEMKHEPEKPEVKASYEAMKRDVKDQWNYATNDLGITFEPTTEDPYKSEGSKSPSQQMEDDVRNNKHLYFYSSESFPEGHPMADKDPDTGLSYNNMFRAVHDLFGHSAHGNQFGPSGERNAYLAHAQMFSPEAIPAVTSETHGQNSWTNFGPHLRNEAGEIPKKGQPGYLSPTERPFAEQKAGILPTEFQSTQKTTLQKMQDKYPATNDAGSLAQSGAGFITPEGKFMRLPAGTQHHEAIERATGIAPSRGGEQYGNAGDVRPEFLKETGMVRTRMMRSRAGNDLHVSVPDTLSDAAVRGIRQVVGANRNGNLILEHGIPGGKSTTKEFASPADVEPMLKEIGVNFHSVMGPSEEQAKAAGEAIKENAARFIGPYPLQSKGEFETSTEPGYLLKDGSYVRLQGEVTHANVPQEYVRQMAEKGENPIRVSGGDSYEIFRQPSQDQVDEIARLAGGAKNIYWDIHGLDGAVHSGEGSKYRFMQALGDAYHTVFGPSEEQAKQAAKEVAENAPKISTKWISNTIDEMKKSPAGAIDPRTGTMDTEGAGTEIYTEARTGRKRLDHMPTRKEIQKFYNENKEIFDQNPALRVGWDKNDAGWELNIGAKGTRHGAELVARKLDQRAAWDIGKKEEIVTFGKGEKTEFPDYPLEDRLKDLQRTPEKGYENLPLYIADRLEPDEKNFLTGKNTLQKNVAKEYGKVAPLKDEYIASARAGTPLAGWWQRFIDTFEALGEPTTASDIRELGASHAEALKAFHGAVSGNKAVQMANREAWGAYADWLNQGRPLDRKSINDIVVENGGVSDYLSPTGELKAGGLDTEKLFKLVNSPEMRGERPFHGGVFEGSPVAGKTPGARKIPSMVATTAGRGNLNRVVVDTHMKDFYGQTGLTDAKYIADSVAMREAAEEMGLQAGEGQEQVWGTVLGIKELLKQGLTNREVVDRLTPDVIRDLGKDYAEIIKNDPELPEIFERLRKFGFDPSSPRAQARLDEILGSRGIREPGEEIERSDLERALLENTVERIKGTVKRVAKPGAKNMELFQVLSGKP